MVVPWSFCLGYNARDSRGCRRAVRGGELTPVRRDLYYRGHRTRYGMTAPTADEIAREVLGSRGIGPVGYSAVRMDLNEREIALLELLRAPDECAELVMQPGAGHFPWLDDPAWFPPTLTAFLG